MYYSMNTLPSLTNLGKRSLASCLSGGDLDGCGITASPWTQLLIPLCRDIFNICQYQPLFGSIYDQPANFPPSKPWKLDDLSVSALQEVDGKTGQTRIDPEKIIPYVCDFVVKYIDSDVLVRMLCYSGSATHIFSIHTQGVLADQHLIRAGTQFDLTSSESTIAFLTNTP